LRLVAMPAGETDVMTLKAECTTLSKGLQDRLAASLRAVTKLGGSIELVPSGSLPNDGKVIDDARG
jgi:phenylacetate-CoA ligase